MVLAAKAAVFTLVAFLTGLAAAFAAFFGARRSSPARASRSASAPRARCDPCAAGSYLPVLGLGAPIRRTAGATALLITVLILLPAFAGALPAAWRGHVNPWLPSVAGQVIIGPATFTPPGHLLSPGPGSACPAVTPAQHSSPRPSLSVGGTPERHAPYAARGPARPPRRLAVTATGAR